MNYYEKYLKYKLKYDNLKKKVIVYKNISMKLMLFYLFITEKLVEPHIIKQGFDIVNLKGEFKPDEYSKIEGPEVSHIPEENDRQIHNDMEISNNNTLILQNNFENNSKDMSGGIGKELKKKEEYPKKSGRIKKTPVKLFEHLLKLTPVIINSLTPNSKTHIYGDLEKDDEIIKKVNRLEEIKDPTYINYENYGKIIETWVALNMLCPCCNAPSLKQYYKTNMPVIDLVCINQSHTINMGVRYFQVKSSNGTLFENRKYFNYDPNNQDNNIIYVGSKKFGKHVHDIKTYNTDSEKEILIGYICIEYIDNPFDNFIRVKLSKSFVVLPKLKIISKQLFDENDYLNLGQVETLEQIETLEQNEKIEQIEKLKYDIDEENFDLTEQDWYYKYAQINSSHPIINFSLINNNIVTLKTLKNNFVSDAKFSIGKYDNIYYDIIIENPLEHIYNI